MKYNLITILGPTATGKTKLAANLAKQLNCEIISADSRQVYRGMDIGTGKDYADYFVDDQIMPYHLVDIADIGYKYNVFEFQRDFNQIYDDIISKVKTPILCGGTGLYIESVVKAYRLLNVPQNAELRDQIASKNLKELVSMLTSMKKVHNTSDLTDKERLIRAIEIQIYYQNNPDATTQAPEIHSLNVGLIAERFIIRKLISERLKLRLENGLITEIEHLLGSGILPETLIFYGLEYKYVTLFVTGQMSYDEMFAKLEIAIHQFSKRQMTWFRKMERNGVEIHWLDCKIPTDEKIKQIINWLNNV